MAAYEFRGGGLQRKAGWPASTSSGGQSPEARGLAAADLDGDGRVEVVATTTNTLAQGRAGLRVRRRAGDCSSRRAGTPRMAALQPARGPGNDLRFNKVGNHGYGAYGENVAIGNIDDDTELEIITTFDNHQINAFNLDGTSILASPWFTNRESDAAGRGWAGGSSSAGPTPGSSGATTTCTRARGRARPVRHGCSGPRRRRRWPTSTATAATR